MQTLAGQRRLLAATCSYTRAIDLYATCYKLSSGIGTRRCAHLVQLAQNLPKHFTVVYAWVEELRGAMNSLCTTVRWASLSFLTQEVVGYDVYLLARSIMRNHNFISSYRVLIILSDRPSQPSEIGLLGSSSVQLVNFLGTSFLQGWSCCHRCQSCCARFQDLLQGQYHVLCLAL